MRKSDGCSAEPLVERLRAAAIAIQACASEWLGVLIPAQVDAAALLREAADRLADLEADLLRARAEVAGAYRDAAEMVLDEFGGDDHEDGDAPSTKLATRIDAKQYPDHAKALDALLEKAREEGRAEARAESWDSTFNASIAKARAEGAAEEREECAKDLRHEIDSLRIRVTLADEAVALLQQLVDPRPEQKGHRSSVVLAVAGSPWYQRAEAILLRARGSGR